MAENIEMIRPINLPEAQQLSENDVFILDSETGGVRKIPKNKVYTPVDDTLSESGEAADAKVTGEKIDELKAETALIQNPAGNKSGELVSFSDGADMPAISVIAHIEPIQEGEGDPSPDNVRQISGWESVDVYKSGVNIWDEEWEQGDLNSITGEEISSTTYIRSVNYTPCVPNDEYYGKANSKIWLYWYDKDKNFISNTSGGFQNTTKTAPTTAHFFRLVQYASTYDNGTSINYPSTDHEYHAYTGQTITKDLGQTVYGGTLDVVSGVLTDAKRYRLLDGTEGGWYNYEYSGVNTFRFIPNDMASVQSMEGVIITNEFTFRNAAWVHGEDYGTFSGSGNTIYFRPPNAEITTLAEFKTWLGSHNLEIVYPRATPQTYQLTPTEVKTLLGENNVWADAGDVEITYRKDINIVIDELTNAIVSLGSNV